MARKKILFSVCVGLLFCMMSMGCETLVASLNTSLFADKLYTKTGTTEVKDIRGNIVTESFLLVYGGDNQIYIQKITRNNTVFYQFLNRLNTSRPDMQMVGSMSTLMIKTDNDDVVTLTDNEPHTVPVKESNRDLGFTGFVDGITVITNFPIPDFLLAQLKKCNTLSWQYEGWGSLIAYPVSIPSEGIVAMQDFLK